MNAINICALNNKQIALIMLQHRKKLFGCSTEWKLHVVQKYQKYYC